MVRFGSVAYMERMDDRRGTEAIVPTRGGMIGIRPRFTCQSVLKRKGPSQLTLGRRARLLKDYSACLVTSPSSLRNLIPTNENYADLGSRWMGGGFTDGPEDDTNRQLEPRLDYWGYSHHMSIRVCDLGFRVVLDPTRDLSLPSRDRVFEQKNRAWMIETPKPSPEPRLP